MSTLIAALVAVGVLTAVYFVCLRPMWRGQCGMMTAQQDAGLDRQIAELREEIRVLRAQDSLGVGQGVAGRGGLHRQEHVGHRADHGDEADT